MGFFDLTPKEKNNNTSISTNANIGTNYKRRPQDEYKTLMNTLDDETRRKMDLKRTLVMSAVIIGVLILIIVLAVTGIGVNKEGQETQETNAFFGLQVGETEEEVEENVTEVTEVTSLITEESK